MTRNLLSAGLLMWAFGGLCAGAASQVSGPADYELLRADQRAQLCSAINATGTGLQGEYFSRPGWQGTPALKRTDATLEFDESFDWPVSLRNLRVQSIRWRGWVKPPLSGFYRFHANSASARITVGNQALVGGTAPVDAKIELSAGRFYPITVELDQLSQKHRGIRLEWTGPHGLRFVIPKASMYVPSETVQKDGTGR